MYCHSPSIRPTQSSVFIYNVNVKQNKPSTLDQPKSLLDLGGDKFKPLIRYQYNQLKNCELLYSKIRGIKFYNSLKFPNFTTITNLPLKKPLKSYPQSKIEEIQLLSSIRSYKHHKSWHIYDTPKQGRSHIIRYINYLSHVDFALVDIESLGTLNFLEFKSIKITPKVLKIISVQGYKPDESSNAMINMFKFMSKRSFHQRIQSISISNRITYYLKNRFDIVRMLFSMIMPTSRDFFAQMPHLTIFLQSEYSKKSRMMAKLRKKCPNLGQILVQKGQVVWRRQKGEKHFKIKSIELMQLFNEPLQSDEIELPDSRLKEKIVQCQYGTSLLSKHPQVQNVSIKFRSMPEITFKDYYSSICDQLQSFTTNLTAFKIKVQAIRNFPTDIFPKLSSYLSQAQNLKKLDIKIKLSWDLRIQQIADLLRHLNGHPKLASVSFMYSNAYDYKKGQDEDNSQEPIQLLQFPSSTIAGALGSLSELTSLSIDYGAAKKLQGDHVVSILSQLTKSTMLKRLKLNLTSTKKCSYKNVRNIFQTVTQIRYLEEFTFQLPNQKHWEYVTDYEFITELTNLKRLRSLILDCEKECAFTSEFLDVMIKIVLPGLKNIKVLQLLSVFTLRYKANQGAFRHADIPYYLDFFSKLLKTCPKLTTFGHNSEYDVLDEKLDLLKLRYHRPSLKISKKVK